MTRFASATARQLWGGGELNGLSVLPPSAMLEEYPDAPIFITMGFNNKIDAQEWLVNELDVSRERIVNYEEYKTIYTCRELEEHCELCIDHWNICCQTFKNNRSPMIAFSLEDSPHERVALLLATRRRLTDSLAQSISCECDGCPFLGMRRVSVTPQKLTNFDIRIDTACNLRCCYCYCGEWDKKTVGIDIQAYRASIDEMKRVGLVDELTIVNLANGELTLHPQRSEILSMLSDFYCYILSNCTLYDDALASHLRHGKTTINCSVDAGTRETYKRVKGVDCFERVCENLRRYSENALLDLKYIFLPGINDDDANIDGFMRLIDELCPDHVILSRNFSDLSQLSDHALDMMARLTVHSQRRSIKTKTLDEALSPAEEVILSRKVAELKQKVIQDYTHA